MAKGSKVVKSGSMTPVRGGGGHMFGKQHAGPQKSGTSATGSKSGSGGKFAKGGPTGLVGKQGKSTPSVAGKISVAKR